MKDDLERDYMTNVGRPAPVDTSDDAWQWDYTGTKAELAELREKISFPRTKEPPPVKQETLF